MKWITERPTVPGWYVFKPRMAKHVVLVEVTGPIGPLPLLATWQSLSGDIMQESVDMLTGEWAEDVSLNNEVT